MTAQAPLRERLDPQTRGLIPTAKPGVYLAESERHPGTYYTVSNIPSPYVMCSCPAGKFDHACKHAIAGLELSAELMKKEQAMTTTEEKTMAVTLAEKSPTVIKAEEARLAAAAYLGGWNQMKELAAQHIQSGFAPKGIEKPEAGAMILLKAIELNIPVTAAYEFIAVINGRPKLMGQMVDALVSRSGKGYIHVEESDSQKCVAVGYREGRKPVRITFTIEDLARMGVNNETHRKYPADHLRWKAIARVGRVMFADVLGGMDVAGVDGVVLDSIDMGQEEGHEGGRQEFLDGEYRVVPPDEGAPNAHAGGEGGTASGDSDRKAETETPAPAGKSLAELLKSAGCTVKDMAPVLGVKPAELTRETIADHVDRWLSDEAGRSLERLVELTVQARQPAGETEERPPSNDGAEQEDLPFE